MSIYTEIQQNKCRWHSLIGSAVIMGGFFTYFILHTDLPPVEQLFAAKVIAGGILFYHFLISFMLFRRLDTRINDEGVHFRVPFAFAKWQQIPWSEINNMYIREYALLGEYPSGSMGVGQGPGGLAYAPIYGTFGLQIEKTTGGRILLGTKQPNEINRFLLAHPLANPVLSSNP